MNTTTTSLRGFGPLQQASRPAACAQCPAVIQSGDLCRDDGQQALCEACSQGPQFRYGVLPKIVRATRGLEILRRLRDACPDGMSTPQIAEALTPGGIEDRQRVLTVYGGALRALQADDCVRRAGVARNGRHHAVVWAITTEGLERLDEHMQAALAWDKKQFEHACRAERAAAAREALNAAKRAYGPGCPVAERNEVADRLLGMGCTLDEIGRVFGIGREGVRAGLARAGHKAS
jgi:hypothetical protein